MTDIETGVAEVRKKINDLNRRIQHLGQMGVEVSIEVQEIEYTGFPARPNHVRLEGRFRKPL